MKRSLLLTNVLATLIFTFCFSHSGSAQNALEFDGTNDYIVTPYNGLVGNSSRTIEAWIRPTFKTAQAVIVDMGLVGTGSRFTFNLLAGKLRIEIQGAGYTGAILVADGKWHHVAVTYDNAAATNKYRLYVDGVMDGAFDLPTVVNTAVGDLRIGARVDNGTASAFLGAIDEVRVWNTVRTLTQLTTDSLTEYCSTQTGLVAYHKFNTGIAGGSNTNDTISIDNSGLNNNGRLFGFSLTGIASNWVAGKIAPCLAPACLNATNLGATNVLANSADIFWTQSNSGSTFKIQYGPIGFTLGQGTKFTTTNDTVFLTGLLAQTAYQFYVKEICSSTDSSTWTASSFTTPCGIVTTYPYTEGFDVSPPWVTGTGILNAGSAINTCWTRIPIPTQTSNNYVWSTRFGPGPATTTGPTSDYSGTGNYMYTESTVGSTGHVADLKTVTYNLSGLAKPQISFQYHMFGPTMGQLSLLVWNGTSYDVLQTLSGNKGNAWNEAIVDLSAYKNQTVHFVFRATRGTSSTSDMAIDAIEIANAPPCPKPTTVFASNITATTFVVNFTSGGSQFVVEYGPTGFAQGTGKVDTVLATGHVIDSLFPNTNYSFYIRTDCTDSANGFSQWVGPISLTTLCSSTNYYTNWDAIPNNASDPCWAVSGTTLANATAYVPPGTAPLQPFSAPNYYRFYNVSSPTAYLVSPEIPTLDSNNMQIRFQGSDTYVGTVGNPSYIVGTVASHTDMATFAPVDTFETVTNAWNEYSVVFSNVPQGHKYIAIKHGFNTNNVYMVLDDIYIEPQPQCLPPSAGTFSNTTDVSTVLSWISGGGNNFEIEYGITGFVQGTGTIVTGISQNSDTLLGLSANTCYDVYIRGNCTINNSPWYGPLNFCTECAVEIAPYFESFDSTVWGAGSGLLNAFDTIDNCWTRTPELSSMYRWGIRKGTTGSTGTGPSTDVSGTGNYLFTESNYGGTGTNTAYITTPTINFSALTNPTLIFSYHMFGATMGSIYITIFDGTQYDTIHALIGQQQTFDGEAWRKAYVDLSAYKATPKAIRIIGQRGSGSTSDMAIDELRVEERPTCVMPSNFAVGTISTNSADFSWSSFSNGTNFKLEYGPVGFTQSTGSGTVIYTSGSPATVSGLTPNTSYDIYLADMCDSTAWVGPITFTTIIQFDAEMLGLLSPQNLFCGDSAIVVEVEVINNGISAITSLPVSATISGATTATINSIYTGTIAPGAKANIVVGTLNSYFGGTINIEASANLVGDQDTSNSDILVSGIELISAVPLHMPVDTLCANDTSGIFVALPQTGISHNWYQNATDTLAFATSDTIAAMPGQTVYLDRSKSASQQIYDATTGSLYGNMIKLYIKNDMTFTGFSFEAATAGSGMPIAFYKAGNWLGHETTRASWTPIDSLSMTVTQNGWFDLVFTNPVHFSAGDTVSLYLANKLATKIKAEGITNLVSSIGDVFVITNEFELYAGVGGAYFGANMVGQTNPQSVSYKMHWTSKDVCGNNRVALTMGVYDTAVASFTSIVDANGADVDFDAATSKGHIFDWNFGDGNTGSGIAPTHTYLAGGTYTVTLIVTDTVCGTTDTISHSILATVSISETLLSRSLNVYPNPNGGAFKVSFDVAGVQEIELAVLNTVGQIIYQEKIGAVAGTFEKELALENLAPGVYFLRVMANGKPTVVKMSIL